MKRVLLLFLVVCILFAASCSPENRNEDISVDNKESSVSMDYPSDFADNTEEKRIDNDKALYFDFSGSENQAAFKEKILNNPIDKSYLERLNDSGNLTTQNIVECESEFADVWKREFEYSCERYSNLLDGELKEEFMASQKQWLDSVIFIHGMPAKTVSVIWSDFRRESAHDMLIELRSHTLLIKYYEYVYWEIIDSDNDHEVSFLYEG